MDFCLVGFPFQKLSAQCIIHLMTENSFGTIFGVNLYLLTDYSGMIDIQGCESHIHL